MNESKKCTKCLETKPTKSFSRDAQGKMGLKAKCKDCQAKYYTENKMQMRAASDQWYEDNKERRIAASSEWAKNNKERINLLARHRRAANPMRQRAANAAYAAKHPEKKRQFRREWDAKNPAAARARQARRRALLKNAIGTHTSADVIGLFVLQRGKCACCKTSIKKLFHVDHIVPLAKGGSNFKSNLQILCAKCNLSKGAKKPEDFMRERGFLL